MANTTVIKLMTNIKDEDIIYVTFHNKVNVIIEPWMETSWQHYVLA